MFKHVLYCHQCGKPMARENKVKKVSCFECKKKRALFWAKKLKEKKQNKQQ